MEQLNPFIGEWSMRPDIPGAPPSDVGARSVFEWLSGEKFLIQRWEIPVPEAPDGIAIIGFDAERGGYLQHYFDSRGVARVYETSFSDGEWKLWRDGEDFSQRFTGTFSDDCNTIAGRWEISTDGSSWRHDFDLTYTWVT